MRRAASSARSGTTCECTPKVRLIWLWPSSPAQPGPEPLAVAVESRPGRRALGQLHRPVRTQSVTYGPTSKVSDASTLDAYLRTSPPSNYGLHKLSAGQEDSHRCSPPRSS